MKVTSRVLYGIDVAPERAASTLSYPILVIHGDADGRIPVEQSVRIHASGPAVSELGWFRVPITPKPFSMPRTSTWNGLMTTSATDSPETHRADEEGDRAVEEGVALWK